MVLNSDVEKILWNHLNINDRVFIDEVINNEIFLKSNINHTNLICDDVGLNCDDINYILNLKKNSIINAKNIRWFCNIENFDAKNLQKINTDTIEISFKNKTTKIFSENRWNYNISNLNVRCNYMMISDFNDGIPMPNLNLNNCKIITDNLEIDDGMVVDVTTNNKIITKNIFTSIGESNIAATIEKGKKFNQFQVSGMDFIDESYLQCIYIERNFSNGCGVVYKKGSYFDDLVSNKTIKVNKRMKINDQWNFVDIDYFKQIYPDDCSFIENYKSNIRNKKNKFFIKYAWNQINVFKNKDAQLNDDIKQQY